MHPKKEGLVTTIGEDTFKCKEEWKRLKPQCSHNQQSRSRTDQHKKIHSMLTNGLKAISTRCTIERKPTPQSANKLRDTLQQMAQQLDYAK
jgi:Txe/YoeB family toxin of Txe-Axe toxin-antitoxin module